MVILGDKGLKLVRLPINGNNFYENSYRLGGHGPPGPPLNPRLLRKIIDIDEEEKSAKA